MLIDLGGRRLYYDLMGPENGQVVCFTHSLASDGGMWAEQVPPLLAAGYRLLRLDMRGHGGSDPVAGDYTMAQLADDVAASLDFLGISRVQFIGLSIGGMIGQAFALAHGQRLISAMLCDTSPQTMAGAQDAWAPRIAAVKKANSLTPLADPTMERWFTDAYKPRNPGRWKQIHATIAATTPAGYPGLRRGHSQLRLRAEASLGEGADARGVRRDGRGHAAGGQQAHRRARSRCALRGDRQRAALPQCRAVRDLQPHHAGLAEQAPVRASSPPLPFGGEDVRP